MRLPILLALLALSMPPLAARGAEPKVGDPAPDYLGRSTSGKTVLVSDHRGKVVVVSFWASWCGPCLEELPVLERLQRVASAHGLQVIAINWKEDEWGFRKMMKRPRMSELQMMMLSDASGRAGQSYGVNAIPHMILIGRDGRIAFLNVGYGESVVDKLVDAVNAALAAEGRETAAGPAEAPADE